MGKFAKLYVNRVVKRHGIPVTIISDRDNYFTSHYLRVLQHELGTQVCLSTTYHLQTDGQSRRIYSNHEGYTSNMCIRIYGTLG